MLLPKGEIVCEIFSLEEFIHRLSYLFVILLRDEMSSGSRFRGSGLEMGSESLF